MKRAKIAVTQPVVSKVWVSWGKSESGDNYGPYVFSEKPTNKQLEKFWKSELIGGDWTPNEPGPGSWGTCVHVQLEATTVLDPNNE